MTSKNTDSVILEEAEHWETWDIKFKGKAVALRLWDLINPEMPEEPFLTQPIAPKAEHYDKKLVRQGAPRATRAQSTQSAPATTTSTTTLEREEEVDTTSHPRNASEMTSAARSAFQVDWSVYTTSRSEFREQQESVVKLKDWVEKTTSDHLYETACDPTDSIREWYAKLAEQVGVSETQRRQLARDRYRATVSKPLNKAPKNVLAWLSSWEQAINFAKSRGVAEVQHLANWFADFTNTIKPFME